MNKLPSIGSGFNIDLQIKSQTKLKVRIEIIFHQFSALKDIFEKKINLLKQKCTKNGHPLKINLILK